MATTADFEMVYVLTTMENLGKLNLFYVKPGKGMLTIETKIRNLNTGRLLENTFTSGVKIDVIRVENRKYQFLYSEGE